MKIVSFDGENNNRIKRDPKQGNLFNLFQKNLTSIKVNNNSLTPYIVPREFEMRLDRISEYLYGSSEYTEELMVINDIINPYSVKEGQYIYYYDPSLLQDLLTTDDLTDENEIKRKELMNSSKPNKKDKELNSNKNLPPTIKPSNLDQIKVSKDNTVQIINSFE